MLKISASLAAVLALVPVAIAQSAVWGQCGGSGWTGPTTCVQGSVCTFQNDFYSQCLPVALPCSHNFEPPPIIGSPTGTSTVKSNTVAKSLGKKLYFGSATDNPELTDAAYVATLSDNTLFGQLTPGNSMKWDATEPSRGTFTFTNGDTIAALAKKNGQLLRGHNCVWYNQLPSWVSSGGFNATLTSILQTHCSTVVKHYAGQIPETFQTRGMLSTSPSTMTEPSAFVFSNALGLDYVTTALVAARAPPAAKLYINDYNIDSAGSKATAMINLVKSLKAAGTPIDGIGIQGHLIVGQVPSKAALIANYQAFTALGVEIAINRTRHSNGVAREPPPITIWGLHGQVLLDSRCLLPDKALRFPGTTNLIRKPAYDGIVAGFTN
ncbi:endo-1,4-beta-xylanase A precursor [Mycena olivaceomarginata]|nr:endo-1,4-beta-xylanase A precursor [Mycena olivaceomarginata]